MLTKPLRFALSVILLSSLTCMHSKPLSAVELATDNLGDVLLFPAFTVNNDFSTFLDIANVSASTVALNVTVRDATDGSSCAKFIVTLLPHDVWIAAIENGADGPQLRVPGDKSCTFPATTLGNARIVPLSCTTGSIEVIQMGHSSSDGLGTVAFRAANNKCYVAESTTGSVEQSFENEGQLLVNNIRQQFNESINALKGTYTLIRPNQGKAIGGTAVALADFYTPNMIDGQGADGLSKADLIFPLSDERPTLNDAMPRESIFRTTSPSISELPLESPIATHIDRWNNGVDAVNAALMAASVHNKWTSNPGLGAQTEWYITFPTRHFAPSSLSAGLSISDRTGNTVTQETSFSNQTSVINFVTDDSNTNITGAPAAIDLNTSSPDFGRAGWMSVDLAQSGATLSNPLSGRVYSGMPAIGIAFVTRSQDSAGTSFGTAWPHSFYRKAQLPQ